ncbi:MAG: Peptidase BlaR1 [Verrucomicrobiaceae bacterium]|nr:Peptidase BlaR1 [Verrucomicrobiaceae bacterium]
MAGMSASLTRSCQHFGSSLLVMLAGLCAFSHLTAATPEITAPSKSMGPAETRALTIRFPRVSFNDITLEEALEYLRTFRGCDPEPGTDSAVNIVIVDDPPLAKISLDLKDITFHETLRYCAELAGMAVTYRDHAALVHKLGHEPQIADLESPLMSRAKAIVLPEVHFYGATVAEAVTYFREKSAEVDPNHQGINMVLKPGTEKARPVSLDLRRIPLSEALCYVAALANVRLAMSDNAFVFSPK